MTEPSSIGPALIARNYDGPYLVNVLTDPEVATCVHHRYLTFRQLPKEARSTTARSIVPRPIPPSVRRMTRRDRPDPNVMRPASTFVTVAQVVTRALTGVGRRWATSTD